MTSPQRAIVTATRATSDALDAAGAINPRHLEYIAQRAADDVRTQVERLGQHMTPGNVIVDVRVTCFLPRHEESA